ncbi:Drug resistance protein [Seiridium cupressi]
MTDRDINDTITLATPNMPESRTHIQETSTSTPWKPKSLFNEIVLISTLCTPQLMTQAGLALSIAPARIISSSFDSSSIGQLSWYAASYSLTVGTFILPAGRLGDVFGHRKVVIVGFLWSGLWSLIAGFSVWTGEQIFFDCCRAMQGIGSALLLPNSIAIMGRLVTNG